MTNGTFGLTAPRIESFPTVFGGGGRAGGNTRTVVDCPGFSVPWAVPPGPVENPVPVTIHCEACPPSFVRVIVADPVRGITSRP